MTTVCQQVVVEVQGHQMKLEVLAVLEFNSDRKRMSVLCRMPDGRSAAFLASTKLDVCFILFFPCVQQFHCILMSLTLTLLCLVFAVFSTCPACMDGHQHVVAS